MSSIITAHVRVLSLAVLSLLIIGTPAVAFAASSSTSITNSLTTATVVGQGYTVDVSVSGFSGVNRPTGTVTVSDGSATCTATLTPGSGSNPSTGSCNLISTTASAKTVIATYNGDSHFSTSSSSGSAHTVNKASTTDVTNTGTLGTASTVNVAYPVSYTVSVTSPGAGTPIGNVLVSDGAATCTGTVAAGTCNLTSTTVGTKTITSRYLGDTNFNASATSTGVSHTVNAAAGPTVTTNQASGQADPTSNSPINFTVIFSSSVSDFATGDVTLSGTAGATTAIVTGSGTTYSVAVSGMTQSGTVIASIAAGVAHDASNNPNSASTATDNTVTYNAPGVACSLTYPSPDLIANPCLETSSTPFNGTVGGPDNWNFYIDSGVTGGGTYPAASYYSGTNAAEVHITALPSTGGEAQWSPSPVAVTPGQAYTYSDEYLSATDTEVDVEYIVDKNDPVLEDNCTPDSNTSYIDCYEVVSSSVKASPTSFSKFSSVITPPPGTVQASVFHLLDRVGSLTIDDASLSAGVNAADQYSQGMVSLTFDDGYLDQFNASSTLNAAGMHGTYYIIPNDTLNYNIYPDYMSPAQVVAMQAAGNDIASHTADHCDLVALEADPKSATVTGVQGAPGVGCPDHALTNATSSQAEITNSKIELQNMGISPDSSLAYPFGSFDSTIAGEVATGGFSAARTIDEGFNTKSTDPYRLVVEDLDASTSVATVDSWIQTAQANNVWLILVFHQIEENPSNDTDIYAETPETLQGVVTDLKTNHVCVLTVGQVLAGAPCVVDTTPPVITLPTNLVAGVLNVSATTKTSAEDVTYTVTANDAVDGPVTPICTPASGSTFLLGDTTVTCTATDKSSNTATATFTVDVTLDTTPVAVTLATSAANPTNLAEIPMTATFSKAVTGFTAANIAVTNGTVTSLSTTTTTATFGVTPTADGVVTASVPAGVVTDTLPNQNKNTASNVVSVTSDRTAPIITLILNGAPTTPGISATISTTTQAGPYPTRARGQMTRAALLLILL